MKQKGKTPSKGMLTISNSKQLLSSKKSTGLLNTTDFDKSVDPVLKRRQSVMQQKKSNKNLRTIAPITRLSSTGLTDKFKRDSNNNLIDLNEGAFSSKKLHFIDNNNQSVTKATNDLNLNVVNEDNNLN